MSAVETGQMSAVPESSGFAWACGDSKVAPAGVQLGGRSPRRPTGSILDRFWDPFGTIFVSFSDICLVIFASIL